MINAYCAMSYICGIFMAPIDLARGVYIKINEVPVTELASMSFLAVKYCCMYKVPIIFIPMTIGMWEYFHS